MYISIPVLMFCSLYFGLLFVVQVTIFGQSSGGTSVYALLASPMAQGLFQAAWMMSGSPILNSTLDQAERANEKFLRNTGCSNSTCLRDLKPSEVLKAVPWHEYPYWAMTDLFDLPVKNVFDGPLAIVDGKTLLDFYSFVDFIYLFILSFQVCFTEHWIL